MPSISLAPPLTLSYSRCMKILSLNIYQGRVYEPLITFLKTQALTTDIFCFQEVPNGVTTHTEADPIPSPEFFSELQGMLLDFSSHFTSSESMTIGGQKIASQEGLAMFIRHGIHVQSVEAFCSFQERHGINSSGRADLFERFTQHARLEVDGHTLSIMNVHGPAFPGDKLDTPERLMQSDTLIERMKSVSEPCIIMGDFNLLPETESVQRFTRAGFINLIETYNIKTTRGTLHKVLHPQFCRPPFTVQEYADYTFTSPSIEIVHFEVPDEPVSDHLPMILTLTIPSLML